MRKLACSFCGRGASEVAKLVAGSQAYICDECVAIASRIMRDSAVDQATPPPLRTVPGWLRRLREVWSHRRGATFAGVVSRS